MIHSKFHSYFWKKIKVFLPTKLSVLLKIIFFISLKSTKITSKIQILRYVTLGHVGRVTYSFKIMLFISTGICDDKLRPQIVWVNKS
jgi:hypothetical protein